MAHGDSEPFYSSNRLPPPPPRQRKPGEHVWTLVKTGRRIDCELRFHGESYGWECLCLFTGDLAYGHRSVLRQQALEEAEEHKQRLLGEGWTLPVTVSPDAPAL